MWKMIWALWRGVLSCRRWAHYDHKTCSDGTKGPKVCQDYIPTHQHQAELLIQDRMDPSFHVVCAKDWPYHLNVRETETQTRQHSLYRFGFLFSLKGQCVQSPSSPYLGGNTWLFELLLPSWQLEVVWQFASDLRYLLIRYFLFLKPFSVEMVCVGRSQQFSTFWNCQTSPSDQFLP